MNENQKSAQIGVTGLAVMGRNLARNLARHGYRVALHNRTAERTRSLVAEHGHEGTFVPSESTRDFVASLERPRAIIIMVKAGEPTDAVIAELAPLLDEGDIIIDCGNAHYVDTRRRERELRSGGLHFVGSGVSGGEEGALNGPSIMPGGSAESYRTLGPMFESIAAHVDGTPCCVHVGPDGAGHFVKMVHNGIEYADMQLIAEAYDLLRAGTGASPAEIADIFRTWNEGDLESFLIEITADVLAHIDGATGQPFIDVVLDQAEQKGTGRWTVQSALDLGIPITGIAEATFARSLSGHADQRAAARRTFGSDLMELQDALAEHDLVAGAERRPPRPLAVHEHAVGAPQIDAGPLPRPAVFDPDVAPGDARVAEHHAGGRVAPDLDRALEPHAQPDVGPGDHGERRRERLLQLSLQRITQATGIGQGRRTYRPSVPP